MIGASLTRIPVTVGSIFGRLTVTALAVSVNAKGRTEVGCACECGATVSKLASQLRAGRVKSCGCWRKDRGRATAINAARARVTHGATSHPLFSTWAGMRLRCENPKASCYRNYGGRGITVCDRWLDFWNFVADMGTKPSEDHSLDRINNDGNYEPSNCRWATRREQNLNKRRGLPRRPKSLRTHCRRGHEYSPENTVRVGPHRTCRICQKQTKARYRANIKPKG